MSTIGGLQILLPSEGESGVLERVSVRRRKESLSEQVSVNLPTDMKGRLRQDVTVLLQAQREQTDTIPASAFFTADLTVRDVKPSEPPCIATSPFNKTCITSSKECASVEGNLRAKPEASCKC